MIARLLLAALSLVQGEGALRNDTFAPVDSAAEAELLRGDRALSRAREPDSPGRRFLAEAFDAWHEALSRSEPGDAARLVDAAGEGPGPFDDADHTFARRTEGIGAGVLRRIRTISPTERAFWVERFAPLADTAVLAAGAHAPSLVRVERDLPATSGAARAALRLADLTLEEGRVADARAHLARARAHAALAGAVDGGFDRACASREAALGALAPADPPGAPDAWRSAKALQLVRTDRFEGRRVRGRLPDPPPLGRTLEPGLAFLANGTAVVQTPGSLVLVPPPPSAAGEPWPALGRYPTRELLEFEGSPPYSAPRHGGWPLLPAVAGDGRTCVLVVGRQRPGAGAYGREQGNALVHVGFDASGRPETLWSLAPDRELAGVLGDIGEGSIEFQPGPVVVGERVFVVARTSPESGANAGRVDLWLLALELSSGELAWRRFLTRAADLRPDVAGRLDPSGGLWSPAQPLARVDGNVFVGTNVGLGLLVGALDGRQVFSLRCRRRLFDDPGWPGSRRPLVASSPTGSLLAWAPYDSDFVYRLHTSVGGALFAAPPVPIGAAEDLVAAAPQTLDLLAREGPRRALVTELASGERRASLFLARGERFAGSAAASERRIIASSDRALYLFDRERELHLLDVLPLADGGAGRGGSVYARGNHVYVVGWDTLWLVRARPDR